MNLRNQIKYRFDNIMSKGIKSSIFLLMIISFFVILFFAIIISLLNISPEGQESMGFAETLWMSLMRTLDPGTMGDDRGWNFRLIMFLVTGYGVVMLSTFIGLISNGILTTALELRKGRSKVLEHNHTLILGWSSKIYTIISELVIANENQQHAVIVVLADKDKIEMEDSVKKNVPKLKNTRLVFRSGSPIDINDLEIVNPEKAKSIIVLGKKSQNSDAEIIKVILAITKNLKQEKNKYHIVAEIDSQKNLDVAKSIGRDNVELILSDEFVSRILVHTSRQAGLSIVFTDLLDFDGDEIYFSKEPKLYGRTFKEALFSYEKSTVIGIQKVDQTVILNPPADMLIDTGANIITISEDDDKVIYTGQDNSINEDLINNSVISGIHHDKILILGWNHRAEIIIRELASYDHASSLITIVADLKKLDKIIYNLNEELIHTEINFINDNTSDKHVLENLNIYNYDHIIILSYQDRYETQQADAHTLITLLHLRNIAESKDTKLNVVSEMLDSRNRELANVTEADDFIVSDNMISLILSQVSENKYLMKVFEQLFKSEGNEIYLKPAASYVKLDQEMNFYTVLESAARNEEIAIGYRKSEDFQEENKNYGVVLNPNKSKLVKFTDIDMIIVLSRN
jgi:voltage-gated potassium channel Kch